MKVATIAVVSLFLAPTAYAADQQPKASMQQEQPAGQIGSAIGTVKKVDREKGVLTIAHGPVEALGWPAMTMGFKAQPDQLAALDVGDEIEFEFLSKGVTSTIIRIEKR
ncbi:copper-binding protein [Pseudomonas sp.]|uniref:copper-binding protein n=1 Tax=Pseudomonas sp. TaxID=306 RepID=UPI0028B1B3FA|nr:copper-binding protein [Pseudomonas sp.]